MCSAVDLVRPVQNTNVAADEQLLLDSRPSKSSNEENFLNDKV